MKRPVVMTLALLACCAAAALPAHADSYPSKPIRMIVAYGPGAGVDVAARVVAEGLSKQMNANVFIENRDGAGGIIGTIAAAKAPPDGYTLLFASEPLTSAQLLQKTTTYDPVKDFTPIARVISNPVLIVTSLNAPYKTFQDMVAYAKANPGKITYATSGKGSSSHLETALIQQRYGLDMSDVPYKTFGPALTDTVVGRVGFFLSAYSALLPSVKGGQTRPLAIGSLTRSAELPDVPTLAEAMNAPGYKSDVWYGILAPAGTPPDIVATLGEQITTTMQSPEMAAKIKGLGDLVSLAGPAEFTTQIKSDTDRWTKVVKSIGLDTLN